MKQLFSEEFEQVNHPEESEASPEVVIQMYEQGIKWQWIMVKKWVENGLHGYFDPAYNHLFTLAHFLNRVKKIPTDQENNEKLLKELLGDEFTHDNIEKFRWLATNQRNGLGFDSDRARAANLCHNVVFSYNEEAYSQLQELKGAGGKFDDLKLDFTDEEIEFLRDMSALHTAQNEFQRALLNWWTDFDKHISNARAALVNIQQAVHNLDLSQQAVNALKRQITRTKINEAIRIVTEPVQTPRNWGYGGDFSTYYAIYNDLAQEALDSALADVNDLETSGGEKDEVEALRQRLQDAYNRFL
jgi:hypothetical protein